MPLGVKMDVNLKDGVAVRKGFRLMVYLSAGSKKSRDSVFPIFIILQRDSLAGRFWPWIDVESVALWGAKAIDLLT